MIVFYLVKIFHQVNQVIKLKSILIFKLTNTHKLFSYLKKQQMDTATFQHSAPITTPICQCACGTRISLDQQLLNERQDWKNKYFCLQKQTSKQIGLLKERIYQQCSTLMHNQFLSKQKIHAQNINAKNLQIQQLTSRIIKLQTALKISQKEKQVLARKLGQEQKRFADKLQQLSDLKLEHIKRLNYLQQQNLSQTGALKVKITEDYEAKVERLDKQNQHLRHKISQFEKKYAAIIPQVQKLKSIIVKKTSDIQALEQQRQKLKESHAKQVYSLKSKYEQSQRLHLPCTPQITQLTHKLAKVQSELAKAKLVKHQVRVQPVYVDRPVEVQRVVQKLIQVQKIVKQYIQPSQDYRQLEEDNHKLKTQIDNIIHQLKIFQTRHEEMLQQHEETVHQYEENIARYKAERDGLVTRIHEQEEELENIFKMVSAKEAEVRECVSGEGERIVVHVNKEGNVNKRVEKIFIDGKVNATVSKVQDKYHYEVPKKTQHNLKNQTSVINQRVTKSSTVQNIRKK